MNILIKLFFPLLLLCFPVPLSEVFCDADGNILKENATIRFPRLADTYEAIANEGPDAFYKGPIAEKMVNDIRVAGE